MTTLERLEADVKEAMKAKNETVLSSLRMAKSAVKNKQIDLMGKDITEEDVQGVIRSMVKQYKDALQDFERAGRTDLADKQKTEIELLERYLPPAIGEAELEAMVKAAINETGATSIKDMGKVMGLAMKKAGGAADGTQVRDIVQKLLS